MGWPPLTTGQEWWRIYDDAWRRSQLPLLLFFRFTLRSRLRWVKRVRTSHTTFPQLRKRLAKQPPPPLLILLPPITDVK